MAVDVTLTWEEIYSAALVGVMRRIESMKRNLNKDKKVNNTSNWASDINGACCELVVSKFLNVYWGFHVNNFTGQDVYKIQVRSTLYKDGHLIVHEWDNADDVYMLVTCKAPHFKIIGGISARKAMKIEPRKNKGLEWWVPQEMLTDPLIIREWINNEKNKDHSKQTS
jgi:hypothetical protein